MRYLLIGLILLVGCNSRPVRNTTPYPAEVATYFMTECRKGLSVKKCECYLEKTQAYFTVEEFLKMDEQYFQAGEMPKEYEDVILDCRYH